MKSSPIKPNKFITHLSDDILNENHHLKAEIIKMRKTLKNYQQQMISQFIKIADQLSLEKPGFIFQSPEECLQYFIKVVDQNVNKNRVIGRQIQAIEKQIKKAKYQRQIHIKQFAQIKQQNNKKQQKILLLQNNCNGLVQTVSKLKKQLNQNSIKAQQQIKYLTEESMRKQKQSRIKYLQQKKQMAEKSNKQTILYRLQIQEQLNKKQKAMKIQIDKKDLQVKALLQSINSYIQKNQKQQNIVKYKLKQRTKSEWKPTNDPPKAQGSKDSFSKSPQNPAQAKQCDCNTLNQTDNSIQVLKSVIKPFSQHTALLQKISELRKQNMELKSATRKNNTTIIGLQSSLMQKTNELNLITSKMQILKMQFQKIKDQLSQTSELLQKSEQQKKDMDHYYDEKWNSQFNKVKFNLEHRYEDKKYQLEQHYQQIKIQIQNERIKAIQEIDLAKIQNQKLISQNQNLAFQIRLIQKEKENQIAIFEQFKLAFYQHQNMQKQEIHTIHVQYDQKFRSTLQKVKQNKIQIERLQNQIDQASLAQTKLICQLKQQYDEKMRQKIEQTKLYYVQIIDDQKKHLNRLAIEIESHKMVIENNQRQKSLEIQQVKERMEREKQKQLRELKLKNYDEIYKIKQKLTHNQHMLKDYKHSMAQKVQSFQKQKQQKLVLISKKQGSIKQLQSQVAHYEEQKKKLQKRCVNYTQNIKQLQLKLESLHVENNSHKCIIIDKQNKINQLIDQKNEWKYELEQCRKQFMKGFKEIKQANERKIQYYKSRIWELQTNREDKGISRQTYDKINNLIQDKKKLETEVALKQAQILIVNQVKQYYEIKAKDLDNKMIMDYQLKQQKQPVLVRKPQRRNIDFTKFKTKVSEDLKEFSGRQSYEIKQIKSTFRLNTRSATKIEKIQQQVERKEYRRVQNRIKARVNSSMM